MKEGKRETLFKLYETTCRSALNRSKISGVDYCLNPYTGCSHACVYCYAGCMMRFSGIKERWGSFVQVKINFIDRLAAQLRRPKQGVVMLSTVTDPYQVIERKYGLTQSCLKLLASTGIKPSLLTKSDLVLRDTGLLKEMSGAEVGFTITTTDNTLARLLEPGAPAPTRRLVALEKLAGAGIKTWVFIAPVIPGLTDEPENLEAIVRKAKQAGAFKVQFDSFNFYPSVVAGVKGLIYKYWPRRIEIFENALRNPAAYQQRLKRTILELQKR